MLTSLSQELLKDHPPEEFEETGEEAAIPEEVPAGEEEIAAEPVEEFPEEAVIEELGEEEVSEEGEGESPSASLAELYVKQDLFDEAANIYRKILEQDPSDKTIRQMLEETLALQAYVEGTE